MRREFIAAALWLCTASFAAAQPQTAEQVRPEALDAVYACSSNSADAERLACYDAAVSQLRQAEQSGQVVAVDRERAARSFGQDNGGNFLSNVISSLPGQAPRVTAVESTVQSIFLTRDGARGFRLANGQTWVQVHSEVVRNIAVGDNVSIRTGAWGAYYIWPSEPGRAYRVSRRDD